MPTILKHFPEESNLHDQRFFQVFFSVSDTSSKMEEGGSVMVKSFWKNWIPFSIISQHFEFLLLITLKKFQGPC